MTIGRANAWSAKAAESLGGARSEFVAGRYGNCANRCYYRCFQAAISALIAAGQALRSGRGEWGHTFVQAEFVSALINRRKLYPSTLRDTLSRNMILRHTADYATDPVTRIQAERALRRAEEFVTAIQAREANR